MGSNANYIKNELIEGLRAKTDSFDYKKLVKLLEELNYNYQGRNPYASSMLIRAVLDHIPPLLGLRNFAEVSNNYRWGKTEKNYMKKLNDFKDAADDTLHKQISHKPDLIDMTDIPEPIRVNILLQECLDVGGKVAPPSFYTTNQMKNKPKIKVELVKNEARWANFAISHYLWTSFRFSLHIDNYESSKQDYIRLSLVANSTDGVWRAKHFLFDMGNLPVNLKPDEDYRVEAGDVVDVGVCISDNPPSRQSDRRLKPEFDEDTLKLEIKTRSGAEFVIPIKPGWIILG